MTQKKQLPIFFWRLRLVPVTALLACAMPLQAQTQAPIGQVISVTQEIFSQKTRPQICWQTIVSARDKAIREQQNTPWLTKYWQPILGAALGGPIAYSLTGNYGADSQKWIWPTATGGAAVGALAGPGATAGGYGLGQLAYAIWPTSLALTVGFSLAGGAIGGLIWKMIFPPPAKIPEAPTPGEYLSEQVFFLQTSCTQQTKTTRTASGYLVKYTHQGKTQSARLKYYPGKQVSLASDGRPLDEIAIESNANQK